MKLNHFYSYFCAIKEIKEQGGKLEKDGWVVNSNLNLYRFGLYFLPIMKEVSGYFEISDNNLKSLHGCPKRIGGYFGCSFNEIESFDYVPEAILGAFHFDKNKINS